MKNTFFREPINGFTHLFGAILSIFALVALTAKATYIYGIGLPLLSVILFGFSLVLLYSASAIYHLVNAKEKTIAFLRRLDHSMIFILICGSYMPYCLIGLEGKAQIFITSLIVILTILGILFKMVWFNCPRILYSYVYRNGMDFFRCYSIFQKHTCFSINLVSNRWSYIYNWWNNLCT